jgi:CO/xanthine dehydrogenase FAD-binding subunit
LAEELLSGRDPTGFQIELATQEAARKAAFVTDKRATEAYRRRLLAVLARRAIRQTLLAARPPERPKGRR